jgi:RNA polymerase sigma-70 factor (ECF subfamily)
LQDTFLQAYMALHTFEERSSFYNWVTRSAINSALIILRRRRTRAEVSYDGISETEETNTVFEFRDGGFSPERVYVHRQTYACLLRSIWNLQPRLRQFIEMQMVGSYSSRQIAQALGISEAAVKSRLARARARLAVAHGARTPKLTAPVR